MLSEGKNKIGRYYLYSILFHGILIGLVIYLGIKYKPEIQSIGSKVVVSVVSRVPGHLASVKAVMQPPAHKVKKQTKMKQTAVKKPAPSHVPIPIAANQSSIVYPKKETVRQKSSPVIKYKPSHLPSSPSVNRNVYNNLNSMVSLNNAYSKIQGSLIRGNIHRFESYVNKITSIIMSNFNINIEKYLNYKSVAAFQISPSGRIYDIRVVKSSGSSYFDSQSIDALTLSSPLPPPPKNFMRYINSRNAGEGALVNFNPKEMQK